MVFAISPRRTGVVLKGTLAVKGIVLEIAMGNPCIEDPLRFFVRGTVASWDPKRKLPGEALPSTVREMFLSVPFRTAKRENHSSSRNNSSTANSTAVFVLITQLFSGQSPDDFVLDV